MGYLIIGHKEHGKTTAADLLKKNFGLNFSDSSYQAAKIFIFDRLKDRYGYKTFNECFIDRRNRRSEWYDLIREYNKDDKSKLAKSILETNDIYVGMRDRDEILECLKNGLFDLVIGIYNPELELESKNSSNIDIFRDSDVVIYNDTTIEDLERKLIRLFNNFRKTHG